jgi:predicted Rossmann fold nucleotide-binding protein DprA/Smf involved in DNA uptake
MALGVLVVQAAQYSGSLIAALLAMEFGREVYGVPGNDRQPSQLWPESAYKAGSQAGYLVGRCD